MSLDSQAQVLPDAEENTEISTSSETIATDNANANAEETDQPIEETEVEGEAKAEPEAAESTEKPIKKPRRRKVDAAMREMEDRMVNMVEDRIAQIAPPQNNEAQPAQAGANSGAQLFERRRVQFNQELHDLRTSQDTGEQAIARTVDDGLAGRNALSDIDGIVLQRLVMDGINPDEVHDLIENYGDKLVPQAPDVEYRTIKRYLRQIRSGNAPKQQVVQKPKVRKLHAPVAQVPGGGGGMERARTPAELKARFMGK